MKNLLSKEHYCYKIYTLLMKSSAYHPPYMANPHFYMKILIPPYMILTQKSQPPINKAGVHTMIEDNNGNQTLSASFVWFGHMVQDLENRETMQIQFENFTILNDASLNKACKRKKYIATDHGKNVGKISFV